MKTAIQIDNLTFHYPQHRTATLEIPSWQVKLGEHLFLHGPSGSGKSTLLNLISGVLPHSSDAINVLDTRIGALSSRQRDRFRAEHLGYVFQRFNLIPYLSAIDNVRLACAFNPRQNNQSPLEEQIQQLLSALGIEQPHWHQASSQLSVGQQQRVAIARAMIHRPQLLIVDEPTSSLDHHHRDAFMTLLLDQVNANDMTLLFVSHDQSLVPFFSRNQSLEEINHA